MLLAVVLKADVRSHLGLCGVHRKHHTEPEPTASQWCQHRWPHFRVKSHSVPARDAGGDRAIPWPEEPGLQAHQPARGVRRVGRVEESLPAPQSARHCSPCEGQAPL